jgi:molybdopterin-containing oxidoreductase family membrane subunit
MSILLGSFGWFFTLFLIFLRVLPAVSVAELKEVMPAPFRFAKERKLRVQRTIGAEEAEARKEDGR